MSTPFSFVWTKNLELLRASLLAQLERIRAGSPHPTIKGSALEAVLRRTLREYLPGYFTISSGQAVNNLSKVSPQLDVIVYDHNVFPHLAVNEDGSVIICCESLLSTVECKMQWESEGVAAHFKRFIDVEQKRHPNYANSSDAAGYFVVVFDELNLATTDLSEFGDTTRTVGICTVEGNRYSHSARGTSAFDAPVESGFERFFQHILFDCMQKGQKDVGDFAKAFEALKTYF